MSEFSFNANSEALAAASVANDAFNDLQDVSRRLTMVAQLSGKRSPTYLSLANKVPESQSNFNEFVISAAAAGIPSPDTSSAKASESTGDAGRLGTQAKPKDEWVSPQRLVLSGLGVKSMTREQYEALRASFGRRKISVRREF